MSSAFSLDLICHQEKNPIIYLRGVQLCTQHLIIHLSRIRTNRETSLTMECSFIQLILSISLSFDRSVRSNRIIYKYFLNISKAIFPQNYICNWNNWCNNLGLIDSPFHWRSWSTQILIRKRKKRINDLKWTHINTNILYLSDSLRNNKKTKEDTYIIYKTRDVTKRTNDESCFCINLFLFYFRNEDNSRQFC